MCQMKRSEREGREIEVIRQLEIRIISVSHWKLSFESLNRNVLREHYEREKGQRRGKGN